MSVHSSYELAALVPPSRRPSPDSNTRPDSRAELNRSSTSSENLTQLLRRRAGRDSDAASALDNYLHLSLKKANPRFADLVWFTTSSVASLLDVTPPITYSRCFARLHTALLEQAEAPFQLCAVAESCDNPRKPFSFTRSLVALVQGRYDDLENAIQVLVVWMLCLDWHLDEDDRSKLLTVLRLRPPQSPAWNYNLPSEIQPEPKHDIFSPDGDIVVFKWARDAPRFSGDLNVHMWQPQNDLPSVEHLTLVAIPQHLTDGTVSMRALVVVRAPRTLRHLRDSFVGSLKDKIQPTHRIDTLASTMVFLVSLLTFIRADLKQFVIGTREQIQALTLRGRRSPSAAKIQYLCHLEDFQVTVGRCCADLARTTELLGKCYSEQSTRIMSAFMTAESAAQTLEELENDFHFLSREIQSHCAAITPVKNMIDEQLGLNSRTRTLVIQILVALYVPLSFVTSFLGMNIDSTEDPTHTNYTAAYLSPWRQQQQQQQQDSSTSDGAHFFDGLNVNRTSDAKQPQTWPLQTFFIAAVPLTVVTILVPLIAGAVFRTIFRNVHKYYQWWRLFVICVYPPLLWILSSLKSTLMGWVMIGVNWALAYVPFIAFCVWRLVQSRRHAKQLRGERRSRLRRWGPICGWLLFLLTSCIFVGPVAWFGEIWAPGSRLRNIEHRVKYVDPHTHWFREGKGVEGMGWALRHSEIVDMLPWIAIAVFYLVRGAFRWCREYWRRRAEKASQHSRDV